MHWRSRHMFSACHTHHNKCTSTRACTPTPSVQQLLCHELLSNILNYVNFFCSTAIKKYFTNIDSKILCSSEYVQACCICRYVENDPLQFPIVCEVSREYIETLRSVSLAPRLSKFEFFSLQNTLRSFLRFSRDILCVRGPKAVAKSWNGYSRPLLTTVKMIT